MERFMHILSMKALEKIDSGYRLPPPPGCPRTMYRMMISCWYGLNYINLAIGNPKILLLKCT